MAASFLAADGRDRRGILLKIVIIIIIIRVQVIIRFQVTGCWLHAGSAESGAWLNAPPISSFGLRISDKAIRIAVGLRVGAPLEQPHQCSHCSSDVDQFFRHGLSC